MLSFLLYFQSSPSLDLDHYVSLPQANIFCVLLTFDRFSREREGHPSRGTTWIPCGLAAARLRYCQRSTKLEILDPSSSSRHHSAHHHILNIQLQLKWRFHDGRLSHAPPPYWGCSEFGGARPNPAIPADPIMEALTKRSYESSSEEHD